MNEVLIVSGASGDYVKVMNLVVLHSFQFTTPTIPWLLVPMPTTQQAKFGHRREQSWAKLVACFLLARLEKPTRETIGPSRSWRRAWSNCPGHVSGTTKPNEAVKALPVEARPSKYIPHIKHRIRCVNRSSQSDWPVLRKIGICHRSKKTELRDKANRSHPLGVNKLPRHGDSSTMLHPWAVWISCQ